MIKAVVFDMDGVLVDSEKFYVELIKSLLRSKQLDDSDEYVHSFVGTCDKDMIEILDKDLAPHFTGKEFLDELHRLYEEQLVTYKDIAIPGVYEALKHFKSKQYKIAIASSSPRETIERVIAELEIEDYFDAITSGYELHKSKPNPEIYNISLEKLGVDASNTIAIEDSMYGIQAAKAAGIYTVALRDTSFGIDQSEADCIVDSVDGLIQVAQRNGGQ